MNYLFRPATRQHLQSTYQDLKKISQSADVESNLFTDSVYKIKPILEITVI